MSYIFKQLKRYAEIFFITLLLVASFFSLLSSVGNFPNEFMPVVGHLFLMLFEIGLLASVPVLLLLKKRDLAKTVFIIYASFWLIATIYNTLGDSVFMANGVHGLRIAISVFEFLIACALLTAIVFYILGKKTGKDFNYNLTALILLGTFGAYFVVFALSIALYAVNKLGWTMYISDISENLFLPAAMFFGLFVFKFLNVNFPEKPIEIPEGDLAKKEEEEGEAQAAEEDDEEDVYDMSRMQPIADTTGEEESAEETSESLKEASVEPNEIAEPEAAESEIVENETEELEPADAPSEIEEEAEAPVDAEPESEDNEEEKKDE